MAERESSVDTPVKVQVSGSGGELMELTDSPRFPRRSPLTHPPTTSVAPSIADSSLTCSSVTIDSGVKTKSSKEQAGRHKLQFKGAEILNIVNRRRATSSPSSTEDTSSSVFSPPKSPSSKTPRSPELILRTPRMPGTPSKSPKGDQRSYTLTAKDVSVLERVSHRAQKRALRVRKPHEVFVEMEELRVDSDDGLEWEETARWIKFEEDVEEGTGRWGRPHISALAFHSLVDLRRSLETGCILLDVEGENFPEIAQQIVDHLVEVGQLPLDSADQLLHILLKKHKHQIDATLWEKLRDSALNRDGALHHLGEEIMHRITSSNHTAETNIDHDGVTGGMREHTSSVLGLRNLHRHNDQRSSTGPLLEGTAELTFEASDHVTFNLTGSLDSLDADKTSKANTTQTTDLTDTNIEMEILSADNSNEKRQHGNSFAKLNNEEIGPNPSLGHGDHHHPSSTSLLRRNKSVLSLMEKIPDEAESLTVLVGRVKFLKEPLTAFIRLNHSHMLGELTEVPVPVRFIYLLLGPDNGMLDYHEVGRAMATLMSDKHFHETAYSALAREDLLDAIDVFLDDSLVLPPGDWNEELLLPIMHERNELRRRKERKQEEAALRHLFAEDPLKHSRSPCGGIWNDLKKLKKRYISDFTDALHFQVAFSIIFLIITFLAPAIAFGGVMEEVTNNQIGETETLAATGMAGIVFGLFAVQPLAILALTGPLLLFEEIIFDFSEQFHLPYLQWRACIALWMMLIIVVFAVTESTFIVTYFSRFSEEIFTGVVAIFFIYEASISIIHVYDRNPLCGLNFPCGPDLTNTCLPITTPNFSNETGSGMDMMMMMMDENVTAHLPRGFRVCNQPNTALWSTVLCIGTFTIAVLLRKFRQGKFLGKKGRRLLSDFGMLTAISTMVIISYILRDMVTVETLQVTSLATPSDPSQRGWFINPFDGNVSVGAGFGAIIPATLLGILIFIENQLTMLLINKPEHKLTKEIGYHSDLLIVGVINGVCGILGMPWLCAAPVRSVQHLQALSVFDKKNAPGEKPKLEGVYEQRVTNIVVHLVILLSPFAYSILQLIPVSVILGVFFYLVYASINGVQLKTRIKLLFTPPKHHPDLYFVRKVRTLKMHLYTIIQVIIVSCLWALKLSPAGMIYPIAIVFLIPVRKFLGRFIFTHTEFEALDSEEDFPEDHEDGEGEFAEFEETHVPY